ncbi:hypothetical protein [Clostridium ihumii]|uniref:hypothetical protein n=1 Tax=Clostridium ihumii TaxID=1470356 RepID=UPI00058DC8F2|nr:hypothetical protein [Clostridium ihumii]
MTSKKNFLILVIPLILIISILIISEYNIDTTFSNKLTKFDYNTFDYNTIEICETSTSNKYSIEDKKKVNELFEYLSKQVINKQFLKRIENSNNSFIIQFINNDNVSYILQFLIQTK